MYMNHLLCENNSNSPIKLLLLYMNLYSFWWNSFKFAQNRQIWWFFWWNCSFRVLAVLNFGFGSFSGTGFSIVSVLFRFRFCKNGSKPSVFRFRLKPNQLYFGSYGPKCYKGRFPKWQNFHTFFSLCIFFCENIDFFCGIKDFSLNYDSYIHS